jgi:hypothetical protein
VRESTRLATKLILLESLFMVIPFKSKSVMSWL